MDLRVNVSQSRLVTGFHLPSPCQLAMAVFGKKSAGCGKYHNLTLGMNPVPLFSNLVLVFNISNFKPKSLIQYLRPLNLTCTSDRVDPERSH